MTLRPRHSPSFRQRVDEFWVWMQANEERLYRDLRGHRVDADEWHRATEALDLGFELCDVDEEEREGLVRENLLWAV